MKADIYDFDKTIVPFDSGSKFVIYCMLHYPWCFITLPIITVSLILAFIKAINFTQFKKVCFMFVSLIPLEKAVKGFWDKYESTVHPWFRERKRYSIVISASPDFLLKDICDRLGVEELICSNHSRKTGVIIGNNCNKAEKVRRLYELHKKGEIEIIDVYSDSLEFDKPIFSLASEKCYQIVGGEKIPFEFDEMYKIE